MYRCGTRTVVVFSFQVSETCANTDLMVNVLSRAGSVQASARLSGSPNALDAHDLPGVLEMLVALYALSVISHVDRKSSSSPGNCFGNFKTLDDSTTKAPVLDAMEFCTQLYSDVEDFDELYPLPVVSPSSFNPNLDIEYYDKAMQTLESSSTCTSPTVMGHVLKTSNSESTTTTTTTDATVTTADQRPFFYSGAFVTYALDLMSASPPPSSKTRAVVESVCAAGLRYGLLDQERLFGIPDSLEPFQVDNRPDANFHFLAKDMQKTYFDGPYEDLGLSSNGPVTRLELYLAYRLATVTIWGVMVACVTGFFLGRAGAPLVVSFANSVFAIKTIEGDPFQVTLPKARRIFNNYLAFLASLVGIFVAYFLIFVEPSTLSYYPITPSCDEYLLPGSLHTSGGSYVTSWGKRRFSRYSVRARSRCTKNKNTPVAETQHPPVWICVCVCYMRGAVRCGAVRCGAVRCGTVRCGTVRNGAVRCGAGRCGAERCGAVRCGAVRRWL